MIELNLIPDVKQEYLKAKKARMLVISGAIIASLVCAVLLVILSVYLFGIQTLRSSTADEDIKKGQAQLEKISDLSNMLTIQSQLVNISSLHENKNASSHIFDLLKAIRPARPNDVTFSTVKYDSDTGTVHIDGQAANGFEAVDVFKKTIEAATFSYQDSGATKTRPVAEDVTLSNLSYGEDSTGLKVLRFSMDFKYDSLLFATTSEGLTVIGPSKQNATDSFKYLPTSLFSSRATDIQEKK